MLIINYFIYIYLLFNVLKYPVVIDFDPKMPKGSNINIRSCLKLTAMHEIFNKNKIRKKETDKCSFKM